MAKKQTEDEIMRAALARVQGDQGEEAPADPEAARLKELARQSDAKRAAEARAHQKALKATPDEADVIYTPLENGDPAFTIVDGNKFKANLPVKVKDKELILRLSTNPWFSVNGQQVERVAPQPRDDDEEMRGLPINAKEMAKDVELSDVD